VESSKAKRDTGVFKGGDPAVIHAPGWSFSAVLRSIHAWLAAAATTTSLPAQLEIGEMI
jgi:hypothetical protein